MIEYKTGSIFDSTCTVLVNPVNCVGVMGAGLAKQFAERYPKMLRQYQNWCRAKVLKLGEPEYVGETESNPCICCFPTKNHWKDKSKLSDIDAGLRNMGVWCEHEESIAFPKLGCGLGGLDWNDVKPLIEKHFGNWPSKVEVYV